eukprot:2243607-Alexandrium_andersonii.AAC.1
MERRLRGDPVFRTAQVEYPPILFTHTHEASLPATRASAMVLQLAEALERHRSTRRKRAVLSPPFLAACRAVWRRRTRGLPTLHLTLS